MREIEDRLRDEVRRRLLAQGGAPEYQDPDVFRSVDRLLRRAADRPASQALLPEFGRKFEVQLGYEGFQAAQLSTLRHMPLQALAESYRAVGATGIPVLLVWGRADPVIPFETNEQVRAALPQAELLAVDDAAHTPNYERPDVVNSALLTFLATLREN